MAIKQQMAELLGLGHQLWQRQVSAAIGALQLKKLRGLAPLLLLLGIALPQLLSQQTAPGGQINFQQPFRLFGNQVLALLGQEQSGGFSGPPQGGAVGSGPGQIPQGRPCGTGLALASCREARQVVAALDPMLHIEAAQPMAHQHNPKGHGLVAAQIPSYGRGAGQNPHIGAPWRACV